MSHKPTNPKFTEFLRCHARAFRSIARRAGPGISSEDLQQEAWLIAKEIETRRGHPIDFSDPTDQSTVMSWITNRFLKFTSKNLNNAIRLDTDEDDDFSIARTLAGPNSDNPLNQLMYHEQEIAETERVPPLVRQSYSQASAYALLLTKFDGKKSVVAKLLGVTLGTFRRKFFQANAWISIQPSLFDGLVHVDIDFLPEPKAIGQPITKSFEVYREILIEQIPLDLKFRMG